MTKYTAPQHTPRKRSLSRRAQIFIVTAFLIPLGLLAIDNIPASAAAKFTTLQDVHHAINTALKPISNAIASLKTQQANQATLISNLQNSTAKSLKVFDANGQEIGLLINHGNASTGAEGTDTIYSTALNRFIYLRENSFINNHDGFTNTTAALYSTSNCTGTPYNPTIGLDHYATANDLMPFSPQTFYIFNDSETSTTITTGSQGNWDWSTNHLVCGPDVRTNIQAYELHPVNLPFTVPVALPLQFKYQ